MSKTLFSAASFHFFKMKKICRKIATLSDIYCFGLKQGKPNSLILLSSTFHTSNQRTLKWKIHNCMFQNVKNLDEALTLFHRMLKMNPFPKCWDFNRLFSILVKMKHFSEVVKMVKKLSLLGCPVDEFVMSTVINCYCKLGEVGFGFGVLGSLIKRGYGPDIVCINCLIKGLFMKGNVEEAVELFKKMVRDRVLEVSGITILIVLDGLSKLGKVGNAVELLKLLEKKNYEISVFAYTAVLDGLCKAGMVEDAMEVLFRMTDKDIHPNIVTYTAFIHGLCNHKKLDFAISVFNDLPSKKIYPNLITYTVMIQGFCQEGLFSGAKEILEKMDRVGFSPNSVTCNIIVQGCLKHPDRIDCIQLFKQIIGRDFQQDAHTFFLLLHQMRGNYGDVTVNNMKQKWISSDTIDQMQGSNVDVMSKSLIQKLISSKKKE